MLFQTLDFLILLLCVMAGLLVLRTARTQHGMLLIASYTFYGWWDVRFLMLILLSTVIDYVAALGMSGIRLPWKRRLGISALIAFGGALFLIPDWPSIQSGEGAIDWSEVLVPGWEGARWAIGASIIFALVGPVLYGLYFRLGEKPRRTAFLITSICANLGMLGFFKYFNFFTESLVGLGRMTGFSWEPVFISVALPVGISFYTFQTMSYTIDAYRRQIDPERSFIRMALYVAYFPQLVAGPILRPQQFLPALKEPWKLKPDALISGANLVVVGLAKKVLIADSVAPMVNTIFAAPEGAPSLAIMLGTALFAVQIYCDFSGYTDIARGVSRMFGVEIPLNFNFPYFSTSIIEFWRRWHISLSTWLRDYLYIPLGGGRCSVSRVYFNLMVTMVLGGLWHGAAWNFVIWGAYQGVLLSLNRPVRAAIESSQRLSRWSAHPIGVVVRWGVTAYFWMLGWLIFRITDFDNLAYCIKKFVLFDGQLALSAIGLGRGAPFTALAAAGAFVVLHAMGFFGRRWGERLDARPLWQLAMIYFVLGIVFFYLWPSKSEAFIYFQF